MANLRVGDLSFVLMAGSYTSFTSAVKRFCVQIRLLLRHPVAYVAGSPNFILLMSQFSTSKSRLHTPSPLDFLGPMGMELFGLEHVILLQFSVYVSQMISTK